MTIDVSKKMKKEILSEGLKFVWSLIDVVAAIRCAISTFGVCFAVTHDFNYSIFTTAVVEGFFLMSLLLIGVEVVAPLSALLALAFSGAMQYLELRVLDGTLTNDERDLLRIVIAFAPMVILSVAYLRRLTMPTSGQGSSVGNFFGEILRGLGLNRGESEIESTRSSVGESQGAKSVAMSVRKKKLKVDRVTRRR